MEIQDSVKDYKRPVDESAWESIAQDAQVVRFNRVHRLRRLGLIGAAAVVASAVIVTAVLLASSPKKSKDASIGHAAQEEVVVQQTNPVVKESQKAAPIVHTTTSESVPVAEQIEKANIASQPVREESAPSVVASAPQSPVPSAIAAVKTENRALAAPSSPVTVNKPVKSTPVTSSKSQDNNSHSSEPELADDNYQLFIPNAFTPNGDGINDLFKVEADFTPLSFEIAIYSRKGELVFLNKDIKLAWDGSFRGRDLPGEVYNYIVKFTNPEGKASTRRGQVTLIR